MPDWDVIKSLVHLELFEWINNSFIYGLNGGLKFMSDCEDIKLILNEACL